MSINVEARNIKLWKNAREGRDGRKWYTYSVSVPRKMADGSYENKSLRLFTARDISIPDEIPNGALVDIDGFLTLDIYEGKDGEVKNIALFANQIKFKDNEANESNDSFSSFDIPF